MFSSNFCGKSVLYLNIIPTRKERDHCVAMKGAAIKMRRDFNMSIKKFYGKFSEQSRIERRQD